MFKNWDWNDSWHVVGMAIVVGLAVFLLIVAFAPKNVDYYYLTLADSNHSATCVESHWTWHTDETAFCTDDKDKALDFVVKANASLRK